jgi:hypothetical protein
MTAKEKAKDLVNGFYQPLGYLDCHVSSKVMWDYAKKAATICCDEFLNENSGMVYRYWEDVKKEI